MEDKFKKLIDDVDRINNIDGKSIPERVMKFNEEFGEYITEAIKLLGFTYKPFDREHFIEESADSLQTMLSVQLAACKLAGVDFQEILDKMPEKNRKWEDKAKQYTRDKIESQIINNQSQIIYNLRFYKEYTADKKYFGWYVDLPDYKGNKGDLQMVSGADTLLNMLAEKKDSVWLCASETKFQEDCECLEFMEDDMISGANYYIYKLNNVAISLDVWLCDVLKEVFGEYPKLIYFKKVQ